MTTGRGMDPLHGPGSGSGPGPGVGAGSGIGAGLRRALPEWWPVMLGLALLFGPTFHDLFTGAWIGEEQGHGPIIFFLALWLTWRKWPEVRGAGDPVRAHQAGWAVLAFGLGIHLLGRSQKILMFEVASILVVLAAVVLLLRAVPDVDLSRCRVIHNLVDYPFLRALARAAPPQQAGEVVLAGRIDAGKGFAEFLDAAAGRLPPHARLTVVGDGPQRAALARRHAGPAIRFLGWQDHAATLALSARAHLCVVPSVCEEACSTTVLEALALGRGCLALARGGTPELAQYQQYPGQLALAASMPDLVARLARLLAAPPRRAPPPSDFGADAARLLPTLLELYAEPADLLDRDLHLEQRRHPG